MDVLRTAVSMLALYDPGARQFDRGQRREGHAPDGADRDHRHHASIGCATGSRWWTGDPKLGFAANFLYTLTGKKPDDVMEHAFDIALTLHADHELNASTFAARVTAATLVRYLLRGHLGHRRAEGSAARRRE